MNKKLIISLGIIAVLIIYLIFSRSDRSQKNLPELEKWEKGAAEILIDKKSAEKLRIYKKEGGWVIGDEAYPADKTKTDKMEKDMNDLGITDFISDGPHYERYDLVPEKAIRVTIKGEGGVLRDVLLGKKSSTNRNTYVKFPEKKEIYLASGSLADQFDKAVADLRDKEIYNVDKDSIDSLELVYKGRKLSFAKVQEEVKPETPKEGAQPARQPEKVDRWICNEYKSAVLNKNKVDSLVNSFSNIRADAYPDMKKEALTVSICTIKARAAGRDVVLNIHKPDSDKKNYFCTSSESPYVFTFREYNANRFFKEFKDFTDENKK